MAAKKTGKSPHVSHMAENQEILDRQADGDAGDGRFRKVIVVTSSSEDWESPEHDSMHNANRLQILEEAMHRGLHPQGEARFDGAELVPGNRGRHTTRLAYSVEVVPANMADAPHTVTVSKVLKEHGGKSQAE